MSKTPYILALLGVTALAGLTANAQTYWSANFTTAEGYQLDQTVIGVNEWEASRIDGPDTDAAVVMHQGSPALRVISTATAGGPGNRNTRIFNADMSVPGFAIIQARMAYEWDTGTPSTTPVRFFPDVESQRAFDLHFHPQDGIYIQTGQGDIEILELADVSYGGYYDFEFAINYVDHTFDMSVTGFRADESPFTFQQSNIASLNQRSSLGRVSIFSNRGDINTLYVDSISVIPEPAYAGILVGLAALFAIVWVRRRNHSRSA